MSKMFNKNEVEKAIGIKFKDVDLLVTALTHSSFVNQNKDMQYNERLEFLGDSVLQLTISEYIFIEQKNKPEGELTKLRSLIVCENSLYEIGKKLNLGEYIRMSKGEELTGGRHRASLVADAVEALIAAIYLDKGMEVAKKFILDNFRGIINDALNNKIVLDYKTKLQELLQRNGEIAIGYELIKYEGPPHRRKFFVEVIVNKSTLGKGEGYSKKEAEQNAAKIALKDMEENNE